MLRSTLICNALFVASVCTSSALAQTARPKPLPAEAAVLERRLYLTTMNLIEREYALNHTVRVLELLAETKNSPSRGFEWGYWNALCHQEKARYSAAASHSVGGITALTWSPDGRSLLSAGGDDKRILVREAASGKITATTPLDSGFMSAAFSPDAKRIAIVGGYVVAVCSTANGERISQTKQAQGAVKAEFSPDGKQVAAAGLDGWAHLFNATTGAELYRIKDRGVGSFYSIAISPDGKLFGSGDDGKFAWIWSTADGATQHQLKGHTGGISAETFSPEGKQFATGSWDCTVKLWDTASGAELQTLRGHTGGITCLRYTPDGKQLFTAGGDGAIKMWDTATGALLRDLRGHTSGVRTLALSPDGKRLASGSDDGDIMLWDTARAAEPGVPPMDEGTLAFNNRKASKLPFRLLGIGVKVPPLSWDATLAVRPVGANAEVWQVLTGAKQCLLEGNGADITLVAISRDKRWIATTDEKAVHIWDAFTGRRLFRLTGHSDLITALAFSEDGRRLVSGSADATGKVWDITTGRLLHTLRGQTGKVWTVGFQNADRRIVTAAADGFARIWDARSGRLVCSLEGQAGAAGSLQISADGRRICVPAETNSLWDGISGKKIADLQGLRANRASVAFSSDSRRLILGGYGGYTRMYETETGRDVLTLSIGGEERWITLVAFSADGRRLDIYNAAVPPVSFYAQD